MAHIARRRMTFFHLTDCAPIRYSTLIVAPSLESQLSRDMRHIGARALCLNFVAAKAQAVTTDGDRGDQN
jgi:hypothetical protein